MPARIEETSLIGVPAEVVWKLLEDPNCWRLWWPACLEARAVDRRPLHDGSRLDLLLRPAWLPYRIRPVVEVATPGRALIWSGATAGVVIRHSFFLEARPGGTLVREREEFAGAGLVLFRILGYFAATHRMFRANLKGLKRLAERSL